MAATISYIEYGNVSTSTQTATQLNFGSTVSANLNATNNPVTVGNYSKSKVFKLSFGGTFNTISNIKLYRSAGSLITGEVLNFGTSTSFTAPTGGSYQDSNATTAIPSSAPSATNITIGGTTTGTITDTENTTDYIFLQNSLSILAAATTIPTHTLTFTWNET